MVPMAAHTPKCAACGRKMKGPGLQLGEQDATHPLCSFECVIQFAVERIRARREHHNRMLRELRRQSAERA